MNDDTLLVETNWKVNDLKDALWENGYEDSDENVLILLNDGRLPQILKELILQRGNEIIEDVISQHADKLTMKVVEVCL